jgi:hypothetical protein
MAVPKRVNGIVAVSDYRENHSPGRGAHPPTIPTGWLTHCPSFRRRGKRLDMTERRHHRHGANEVGEVSRHGRREGCVGCDAVPLWRATHLRTVGGLPPVA